MLNRARPESRSPVRLFQLAAICREIGTAMAGRDRTAGKEAILETAGQQRQVLQVPDRLSLSVQNGLYALDDSFAMRQKKPQQLDVCGKRRPTASR